MADSRLREMVNMAESNISKLFEDDSAMKNFLEFIQKNEHLTYYAAAMVDGTDHADTYDGWKNRGYQVNAGERGTAVFNKRKTIKRKFIDEDGKIRDLSTASYLERQKIQNGDLKISSDLSSYYIIEHLFTQVQTTAKEVNLDVEIPESILNFDNIKSVIEDSANDILDGDDFVVPNTIMDCTIAYATYMLCLSDNVPGERDKIFEQAISSLADSKARLTLSEKKLVLNSALKVVRSEHTRDLLKTLKSEIKESRKIVASDITNLKCISREYDKGTREATYTFECDVHGARDILTYTIVNETNEASFSIHTQNNDIWDNLEPREKEKLESRISNEATFFNWKQKIDNANSEDELSVIANEFFEVTDAPRPPRSVSLRIYDAIGERSKELGSKFFEVTIDGHDCNIIDKWKNGSCDYTLAQDVQDNTFYYATVEETQKDLKGTYNYEFDYKPPRELVGITHLNNISAIDIDNHEKIYGADGEKAFPRLNEEPDVPEKEPETKNKIEDFGKKIGGARKDLWKQRGLIVGDLFEMNIAEKNKYATKNNIFPKPDYQKMVDEGLSVRTAYFIKTIRDALPAKPVFDYSEKDNEELMAKKIEGYVEFISEFKDTLLKVKTDADILSFYRSAIRDVYVKNESTYRVVPTEKSHGCITNKLLKACQISEYGLSRLDSQIKKKQFCYSDHDKKVDGFEVAKFDDSCEFETDRGRTVLKKKVSGGTYFFYPEGEFADASKWIKDTCYVLYKRHIVANNLSEEQAKETIENMADKISAMKTDGKEGEKKTRKKKFIPKQLQHIERTGPSNGINEYHHADGQLYLDTFGFAGGEFGNWMNENDRQASLDFGYDAFMDLADALCIDPKDISLGGELSIAFGSRGISSAAAHYEPLRQVINLTKMNGAGSLAHEWGHALDNILSKKIKGSGIETWLTDAKRNDALESVKNLIHTMEYRSASDNQSMEKTDFYTNSIKFDSIYGKESKGYWQSKQEMFARAFACYVKDKLNYKSDYLCGHADTAVALSGDGFIKAFPEGKEREAINQCFDEVIAQLKDMGLLHSQEHTWIRKKSR